METMTGTTNRSGTTQVELMDEQGRLIGVIRRPVSPAVLGPGREKVYLARPSRSAPHLRPAANAA